MSSIPQVQTDQFAQTPSVGDVDLAIARSNILSGKLYTADPAGLIAGTRVKIDTSVTVPNALPQFVVAADNEAAFGVIKRTAQKTTFFVGDVIEVAYSGGPAMYFVAGATITPGELVAKGTGFIVAVDGSHLQMGISLDYATDSTFVRVIVGFVAC